MKKLKTLGEVDIFKDFKAIEKTFGDIVDETAANYPTREAFIMGDARITFSQFQARANQIAKGLIKLGIQVGEHVALLMQNIIEYPLVAIAISKVGGVIVPCNTRFKQEELEYVLNKAKVTTLIMTDEFAEAKISYLKIITALTPELASSHPGRLQAEKLPYLKTIIVFQPGMYKGCYSIMHIENGSVDITDEILKARQTQVRPNDNGMIIFTSGTTGFPKGVLLRYSPLITNSAIVGKLWNVEESDKILSYIPFFTVYGTVINLLGPFVYNIPMVVGKIFDPGDFLQYIEKEKITILATVPSMIESLYLYPKFVQTDFTNLKTGNIGGALCPPEMMRRARSPKKSWGMNCRGMMTQYGVTEYHAGITSQTLDDPEDKCLHTVGRVFPLTEIKIVDPMTGVSKKPGEEGEIIVKGHGVMSGYFEDPDQTAEKIKGGWLHTGDLAVIDEDGYIKITGRATDMIITGAFNVFPKEIENKILEHPKVMSVSAFGVPDKKYGEVPMAHIILKPEITLEAGEIIAFCKDKMASYKVPKYVEFVKEFPINPGGKVQKFKQKEMAIERLGLNKNENLRLKDFLPHKGQARR